MWLLWWSNFSWLSKKLPILWVCGGGEPSIKGEAEVVDGFGEGCGVSDDYVQFVTVQLKTVFILKKRTLASTGTLIKAVNVREVDGIASWKECYVTV